MKSASPVSQYLMIGSVASQFSCCFVTPRAENKSTSASRRKLRTLDLTATYLHNATWVQRFLSLSHKKLRNLNQRHQKASKGIRKQQNTSKGIIWRQKTKKDIKRYQTASKGIKIHIKASNGIKSHQKVSKAIKWHQKTSLNSNSPNDCKGLKEIKT